MPPPSASLANVPDAVLLLTIVWERLIVPQLSIPPPPASAKGHGPVGQAWSPGFAAAGATALPVMTLSLMVRFAPRPEFAAGGTEMPPPKARLRWRCAVRVTPPVIVTPRMVTVGSSAATDTAGGRPSGGDAAGDRHTADGDGGFVGGPDHAGGDDRAAAADDRLRRPGADD